MPTYFTLTHSIRTINATLHGLEGYQFGVQDIAIIVKQHNCIKHHLNLNGYYLIYNLTCAVVFKIDVERTRYFKSIHFLLTRIYGLGFLRHWDNTFCTGLD